MIIELEEGVIFHYNKKEKAIHFVQLDDTDDDFLYSIKGWFGEKLLEFLNSNRNLKEFLQKCCPEQKLREIFKQLLVTLIEKKILAPLTQDDDSILCVKPFAEKEYTDFGTKNFSGSILITEIGGMSNVQPLAYSFEDNVNDGPYADAGSY